MRESMLLTFIDILVEDIERIYGLDQVQLDCCNAIKILLRDVDYSSVDVNTFNVRFIACYNLSCSEMMTEVFKKEFAKIEGHAKGILSLSIDKNAVKKITPGMWEAGCVLKTILSKEALKKIFSSKRILSECTPNFNLSISTITGGENRKCGQ